MNSFFFLSKNFLFSFFSLLIFLSQSFLFNPKAYGIISQEKKNQKTKSSFSSFSKEVDEAYQNHDLKKILSFNLKDFKNMSELNRARHMTFLIRTHQILEFSLEKDHPYKPTKKKPTSFWLELLKPDTAHALLPLGAGAAALGARVVSLGRHFSTFIKKTTKGPFNLDHPLVITGSAVGNVATFSLAFKNLDPEVVRNLGTARPEGETKFASAAKEMKAGPKGHFCLFGGYDSYYTVNNGEAYCVDPKKGDSPPCNQNPEASFLCQSFGLVTEDSKILSLCVSKEPINTLSRRCFDRINEILSSQDLQGLNADDYENLLKRIKKAMKTLDRKRGFQGFRVLEFCQDDQAMSFRSEEEKETCQLFKTLFASLNETKTHLENLEHPDDREKNAAKKRQKEDGPLPTPPSESQDPQRTTPSAQ
jgi:hypothetical protein